MKILIISHEFPPIGGGGANACMFLSRGYAGHDNKVTVVTVWYEGLAEHETVNGVEIYRVKSARKHKEHCSFKEMLDYIRKALPLAGRLQKKEKYDVCQVFFGIPSGPIGWFLKKMYKLPYIIRFGGGDIPGFQDRFKTVYKLIGPFVKILWRNADALVANSEGLKDFALKFYNKKPVKIIYNGVDTETFYPDYEKRDGNTINLLFISRLIERKGLQYIIPALNKIQSSTDKQVHLTIVGDGPYRQTLEELVHENKVDSMVTFVGQKDKNELLPYYQSGDIFVFPSKREGMPNAVLEAMACGLPIVMTPCEGSKELVNGNGTIVSAEGMGDTLCTIVKDTELLHKWGLESRKRAVEQFSWDSIVAQYEEVLSNKL